jgi:hypothetical protein
MKNAGGGDGGEGEEGGKLEPSVQESIVAKTMRNSQPTFSSWSPNRLPSVVPSGSMRLIKSRIESFREKIVTDSSGI